MDMTEDLKVGLGIAINEADLLGLAMTEDGGAATITLSVLTLAPEGPEPADRILIRCSPVGRVAASLRHGRWDDDEALVEPVTLTQLSRDIGTTVSQIYGWDFVDPPEALLGELAPPPQSRRALW